MIERRYPIQTVLAERKMFAGGGAVLPQQMMPQQQQSGGILASSGPLLDAVAAGAINPDGDGGASLSDVQGFQNGGLLTSQDLPYQTRSSFETQTGGPSDRPDSRFLPESGMTTDFSAQLTGATDEQLRQFISSVDPITQGYVLSQAQSELDRRNSLGALNTQPVNSLTPSYDFNDVSDNAEDQAEGFSGQDQDPGGMTGPGFSNFWDQDPKTSFTISGIKESHPARSTVTQKDIDAYNAAKSDIAFSDPQTQATMDVGYDATMDSTAGGPTGGPTGGTSTGSDQGFGFDAETGEGADSGADSGAGSEDEAGAGSEDEGAAAADGGYFTSRMYNANAGQSGYPNMTAAEEIENGVQRFFNGGSAITPQAIPVNLNAEAAEAADAARGAMVDFGQTPWLGEVSSRITPYKTPVDIMAAIKQSISLGDQAKAGMTESEIIAQAIKDFPATYGAETEFTGSQLIAKAFEDSEAAKAEKSESGSSFDYSKLADEGSLNEEFRNDTIERDRFLTADGTPVSAEAEAADVTPVSAEAEMSNADARAELAKIDPLAAAEFEGEDIDAETNEIDSMRGLNTSELEGILNNSAGGKDSPAQTSSAAVTKTIADYSKDFADAMPAYEGMSDSEKGFAIMEAGLRIMAGQSSNALTNIAEGLKGLGPKFAKDAKERRAWNRQIDLSAAKYGLENVARETAEIKADIRAGRKLYNNVFTVKPGETFEYNGKINGPGSTIILKVSDVRDGAVDLSSLQTEKRDLAAIKAHAAQTTARLKALQGSAISPNKFSSTSKQYIADSMRLRTNVATQSLLSRALVELQKPGGTGPLGIKATAKNAILDLANAFGGKQYAESAFGQLDSQKKFDDFTNRAVTTQIEGLINEGGKITDQERRLAKEIGGALSKGAWSGIFEDKDKLENQILEFSQALDRDSETRFRSMALSEKAWSQHYRSASDAKSGFSYGDLLRESRPDLQSSASPRASGVLPKEINWRDVLNIDKNGGKITFKRGWKK